MIDYSSEIKKNIENIALGDNMDEVLQTIAVSASKMTKSFSTSILLEVKNNNLKIVAVSNPEVREFIGYSFPKSDHLSGRIYSSEGPLVINNYNKWEKRFYSRYAKHAIGAAIKIGGENKGIILSYRVDPNDEPYTEDDKECLNTFCNLATIAVINTAKMNFANKKLVKKNLELRELLSYIDEVEQNDRRILAEYMHDDVLQVVYGTTLISKALVTLCGRTEKIDAGVSDYALQIYNQMQHMEKTFRETISTLNPFIMEDDKFYSTLKEYLINVERKSSIKVTLENLTGMENIDSKTATITFKIIKEAVSNAYKHSRCSNINVKMEIIEDTLEDHTGEYLVTTIKDNGIGFEKNEKSNHYGLRLMRNRAKSCGGNVLIQSEKGIGTTVTAYVPIDVDSVEKSK